MIKKLDKLIIKTFTGPFLLTFAVVEFILLLVNIVKYMEEISGKDLGLTVYAKLFSYFALNIVPAALPLAILLSSLMTFGGLGEHRELTAIKSAGISLLRILQPVFYLVIVLSIALFVYGNTIMTWANLEMYSLLYDIKQKKPTMEFKEGVFYNGLPGYRIKISQKSGEQGQFLKEVMIYDHTSGRGNTDVILADSGTMYTINNDMYLVLELFNGNSYTQFDKDKNAEANERFLRSNFEKSKLIFNLSAFAFERTEKNLFKDHKLMKNMNELKELKDSVSEKFHNERNMLAAKLQPKFKFLNIREDTIAIQDTIYSDSLLSIDSILNKAKNTKFLVSKALNQARAVKSFTESNGFRIKHILKEQRRNEIEYWKKTAIPFSCIILFLIGAPLGAIIKKGGIGLPVIISIFFFIILYVINEQGRKWTLYSEVQPWFGMWMSNIYLFPIGLLLLYQAKNDSNFLEFDYWKTLSKKILNSKTDN